jgi:signal transduction histidine kinase
MRIHQELRELPISLVLGAVFLLAILIGWADAITPPEIDFAIFYLTPVMLCATVATRWQRLVVCLFCGFISLAGDLLMNPGYSEPWLPYWNILVRVGIFVVTAELTAEFSSQNLSLQKEITERRRVEDELIRLNSTLEAQVAERTAAVEERALQLSLSEAALRQQRGILESILKNMGEGIIVTDTEGAILLHNPEADRLLHLGGETRFQEWLKRQPTYLPDVLAHGKAIDVHPLETVFRGAVTDGAEMLIGDQVWVHTIARPLADDGGKPTGGIFVFSDMTARKKLEKQVAEISEREQRRIGQDLHDGVCQSLVSTALACNLLGEMLVEEGSPHAKRAAHIAGLLNQAAGDARNLAHALYSIDLTGEDLFCNLHKLARTTQASTHIRCRFTVRHHSPSIQDPAVGASLYRIVQEAIGNAVKHSRASEICVDWSADDAVVLLTISDDGVGFLPGFAQHRGMGLDVMNYRARMIGATLRIEMRPGGGTIVTCSMRIPPAPAPPPENNQNG